MTPEAIGILGLAICTVLCGVGSSIGLWLTGSAAAGVIADDGKKFSKVLILVVLPATQGIYGFVCLFMVQGLLTAEISMFQAAAVFGAGLLVGIVNLAAAIYQGKVCANGIAAIGNGHDVMGKTLILAAFPELYAILTVAATFLISNAVA